MAVITQKCLNVKVTVIDINEQRIATWNDENLDKLPIYEPALKEVVQEAQILNQFFTTDVSKTIDETEMVFISVNILTKTFMV